MVFGILNFATETAILLLSGCVSIASVGGICAAVAIVAYKNFLFFWPGKREVDTRLESVDELDSSVTKVLASQIESQKDLKNDKSGTKKIPLTTLKDYLRVTVASSTTNSTYDKDGEIREFLEHLVGNLISANLDDVLLSPLSEDDHYISFVSKYQPRLSSILTRLSASLHSDLDSESLDDAVKPSTLYSKLGLTIREVQEEATLLPPLADNATEFGPNSIESRLEGQKYEEILSIAVLNKIISQSQSTEQSKNIIADMSNDLENKYQHSDRSSNLQEKFSMTIEEQIEEITTRYPVSTDDQESLIASSTNYNLIDKHRAQFPELGKDIVDVGYNSCDEDCVTEFVSTIDSWEDNWLFQKKKKHRIKRSISQVSVPMLVPNPSEKYRALIGGVDVDETSDLSECSDSILEDVTEVIPKVTNVFSKTNYMYKYDFNSGLEAPTFKNDLDTESSEGFAGDHDLDSSAVTSISRDLSDVYSFSSASPCRSDEDSLLWSGIREAKNEHMLLGQVDSGEGSLDTQPEHEEANLSSTEEPVTYFSDKCEANIHYLIRGVNTANDSSLNEELATPPKPGTIADRQHRKWEQASPISNNPYSRDSIEKRKLDNFLPKSCIISTISNQYDRSEDRNTSMDSPLSLKDISRYGRDYYVNMESTSSSSENHIARTPRSMSQDETSSQQNSCGIKPSLIPKLSEIRQPNLVRVSSWSDRKKPDIEIRKHLPSVKELARQFSGENCPYEVKRSPSSEMKNQMIHSLTARSMSREFREGLKNSGNKTFNRNISSNGRGENYKSEKSQTEKSSLEMSHHILSESFC